MSAAIIFKDEIFIPKIFDYKQDVIDYIDKVKLDLQDTKNRLLILISGDLETLIPDDEKDFKINWTLETYENILENIEENNILLYKLEMFLDYLTLKKINKIPEKLKDI